MALSLAEATRLSYSQDWTRVSNFGVNLYPMNEQFQSLVSWTDRQSVQQMIDLCVVSIDVPQYQSEIITELIGGKYRIVNALPEVFQLSITFRDLNQAGLYRKFAKALALSYNNYHDACIFYLGVYLDANDGGSPLLVMETSDAYITSVSQIQLSNSTESEVMEFTVEFQFNIPSMSFDRLEEALADENGIRRFLSASSSGGGFFTNLLSSAIKAGTNFINNKITDLGSSLVSKLSSW